MRMERAIESFVAGFCLSKSFTHPYVADRRDDVWVLRDGPGRREPRGIQVVAYGSEPTDVLRVARQAGGRWSVGAIADPGDERRIAQAYKALGLRLRFTEPFFVADTRATPEEPADDVRRVDSAEEAESVRRASRRREILPEHLGIDDAPLRLYAAWRGGEPVGWVKSIRTHDDAAWVSNLYVACEHRRQGIGSRLMHAMLHDDARLGIERSVLLASTSGALLYPTLGYRRIGTLVLLMPPRNG